MPIPTPRIRLTQFLILITVIALLASSCSGQSDEPAVQAIESTLLTSEDAATAFEVRARRAEELTAECVKAQGFEYERSLVVVPSNAPVDDPALYAAQHGYGFSTGPLEIWLEDTVVPLTKRFFSTEAEAENYRNAIEACRSQANDQVSDQGPIADQNAFFADVITRTEADPRVQAIYEDWSSCMSETGYPSLENPQAAYTRAASAFSTLRIEIETYRFNETRPTADKSSVVIPGLNAALLEKLDATRNDEIELAVEDVRCMEPWRSELSEIETFYIEEALR